jgi:hypothetical protein
MSFSYQVGKVVTTTRFQRPNIKSVGKFFEYILPIIDKAGLELRIQGACLKDMSTTWDLDMHLLGSIEDQALEDLMHVMYDHSLNRCNLMIDLVWFSEPDLVRRDNDGKWHYNSVDQKFLHPMIIKNPNSEVIRDVRGKPNFLCLTEYLVQIDNSLMPVGAKHARVLDADGFFDIVEAEKWWKRIEQ